MVQDQNVDSSAKASKGSKKEATGGSKAQAREEEQILDEAERAEVEPNPNQPAQQFTLPLEDLVSRFTQATNELQLLGIVKADVRKKKGRFAQRLVWATGS